MDLGGDEYFFTKSLKETRNYHYILIENMETDLPPSVIVDFIYQQISVSSHAYVTPSFLSESYTRGTIFLDGQEKLEKLSRFLHNPIHLISSCPQEEGVAIGAGWQTTIAYYIVGLPTAFPLGFKFNFELEAAAMFKVMKNESPPIPDTLAPEGF